MPGELDRWAAERISQLTARAEAEVVAELKQALLRAAAAPVREAPSHAPRAAEPATTPSPASAGHGLWAYCVARDDPGLTDGGAGLHPDGDLEWVRAGGLAVLCSRVPLNEFGEVPLQRNLNDLSWLERVARTHEAAIEAALAQVTVVPLGLCTIFADEDGARRMLHERSAVLDAALVALDGREEWSVKLLVDRERLESSLRESGEPDRDPGSGAAYMLLRREERRLREAVDRLAADLAHDVHARLQERAVDARVRPPQNRELSGHQGEMVLNGAYLVERDQADGLRELVAELEQHHLQIGAQLELGGPFPPYSFVPEHE